MRPALRTAIEKLVREFYGPRAVTLGILTDPQRSATHFALVEYQPEPGPHAPVPDGIRYTCCIQGAEITQAELPEKTFFRNGGKLFEDSNRQGDNPTTNTHPL